MAKQKEKKEYDNKQRGVLFVNDKDGVEKRPDYRGNYTDQDGNEFWVAGWRHKDKNGKPFISFTTQPKED